MKNIMVDSHIHSNNSKDALDSVIYVCNEAIRNNMDIITITDHCEINAYAKERYDRSIRNSIKEINRLKKVFKSKIEILAGIELGQAIQDVEMADDVLRIKDVDFILASVHNIKNMEDFYYMDYSKDTVYEVLDIYFDEILQVIEWGGFDSLAHLTYPLRYIIKNSLIDIDISNCYEKVDVILKALVEKGKALEINISGLRDRFGETLPSLDIIKRFKQLGGEFITVGSGSHRSKDVGKGIEEGISVAIKAGFSCITVYKNRVPYKISIF